MNNLVDALSTCTLFQDLPATELQALAAQLQRSYREYQKEEIIAFEEDECTAIGVVLSGSIRVERIFPSGKTVRVDRLEAGNSFGEAIVFSDQGSYPATLTANEATSVVSLSRAEVPGLCARSPRFLSNFLRLLSNKILMLNRKIKSLAYQTVRQKVAGYLLDEQASQKSEALALPGSRREMAESLDLPRPSLSRELAALKAAGWIDYDRRTVRILDAERLEGCLRD
jgi:CRP-like cAMP-binding protein